MLKYFVLSSRYEYQNSRCVHSPIKWVLLFTSPTLLKYRIQFLKVEQGKCLKIYIVIHSKATFQTEVDRKISYKNLIIMMNIKYQPTIIEMFPQYTVLQDSLISSSFESSNAAPPILIDRRRCYNCQELHVNIITTVELNCELQDLTFSIYKWFYFNTVFIQNNIVFILDRQFSFSLNIQND